MRPITYTFAPTLDADGICAAQTAADAGNLALDGALVSGGSVTLSAPCRVAIAGLGDNHAVTFTVYGTDRSDAPLSEAIAGPNNSTVTTTKTFKTVNRVAVSAALTGDVTVGTGNAVESLWIQIALKGMTTVAVERSSDANYTYTVQWAFAPFTPGALINEAGIVAHDDATLASKTANGFTTLIGIAAAVRVKIVSFVAGSATVHILQEPGTL